VIGAFQNTFAIMAGGEFDDSAMEVTDTPQTLR
jgi:hypothetical protein